MKKFIIGWIAILFTLAVAPQIAQKIQPKVVEVRIPYVVIQEKIVEKPVFKGEKIVEKIVYKPTPIDVFQVRKVDTVPNDPFGGKGDIYYRLGVHLKGNWDARLSWDDTYVYLSGKEQKYIPRASASYYGW